MPTPTPQAPPKPPATAINFAAPAPPPFICTTSRYAAAVPLDERNTRPTDLAVTFVTLRSGSRDFVSVEQDRAVQSGLCGIVTDCPLATRWKHPDGGMN